MVNALWYVLAFVAVASASWLAVGLIRSLARRCNILDVPNERSSHDRPMPLGGGLAIVLISVAACAFFGFVHPAISPRHALIFLIGALLVAGISLLDDLGHVHYQTRLGLHAMAAIIFVVGYGYWDTLNLPLLGTITLGVLGIPLTFFWIVGLTNAYNFMDGVDGMAAGQAVVAGLGWILLGGLAGHPLLITAGVFLAASSLGFLVHNWHPATIFMGDVGSTFLGFSFAVLPIIAARSEPKLALAGVLLVWPTIFDSGFTVIRRLRQGENIFVGHRTFLFHRLVGAGWGHSQAASFYLTLPILGAMLAFTWDRGTPPLHLAVVIAIAGACASLWLVVCQQERRLSAPQVPPSALLDGEPLARADALSINGFQDAWSAPLENVPPPRGVGLSNLPREMGAPSGPSTWDGVERRSRLDRRSGKDRRRGTKRGRERRVRPGRRATDLLPTFRAMSI
jgi:UDP-N-acetylmuramyl pentapeptide phosphotransferase/UDP-N-acetylglucosamine-1-phosphate transferase